MWDHVTGDRDRGYDLATVRSEQVLVENVVNVRIGQDVVVDEAVSVFPELSLLRNSPEAADGSTPPSHI